MLAPLLCWGPVPLNLPIVIIHAINSDQSLYTPQLPPPLLQGFPAITAHSYVDFPSACSASYIIIISK